MAMQHGEQFVKLVDSVRGRIRECTVAEIAQRQQRGESFELIDVREDHEWAKGHLPQA